MLFSELLTIAELNCPRHGRDVEVLDVQIDSRRCRAGSCFVAMRGTQDDGHAYISAAIAAGASAVICEDASAVNGSPCAVTENARAAAGPLAQAAMGWPVRELTCVGITGTNGKTTVAYMIRAILASADRPTGMLGTISYETGAASRAASATTPDPVSLAAMTAEMVAAGKTHLVIEASSHALDQHRVGGLAFDVAVFTNLTGDHLDYHGDMDSYLAAKSLLFAQIVPGGWAVLNRDDPAAERIAAATDGRVCWYGLDGDGDVGARIESCDVDGSRFQLLYDGRSTPIHTPMIGRHNVQNCLAAAAATLAMGIDAETIAGALANLPCVPGRLERVDAAAPYRAFVDYAHTDDALQNVLSALRPVTAGRLIVVFGCGGDRDRTKRPRMACVAEHLADRLVVTSDNPRSEEPSAIIDEILAGLSAAGRSQAEVEPDRRAAIALAVDQAEAGDVILIAGKGHETYQIIGDQRLDFDDVRVAAELIARRECLS